MRMLCLRRRDHSLLCVLLKYNASPETIDEMIRNLREMQTEIQDCLAYLEISLNDVCGLHDLFHRQLVRVSIYSRFSTSTALTARLQLVSWLEKFGGQLGFSEQSGNECTAVSPLNLILEFLFLFELHSHLQADQDEDERHTVPLPQDSSLADMDTLLDAEMNPAPPPHIVPLNGIIPPARVEAIPPQNTNSGAGTGGSNAGHYFVPPEFWQTGSDAHEPSTSGMPAAPAAHRQTPIITSPTPSQRPQSPLKNIMYRPTPPAVPRPPKSPLERLRTKLKAPLQARLPNRWLPNIEEPDIENDSGSDDSDDCFSFMACRGSDSADSLRHRE